jgi:hypothetical protein
MKKAPVQRAAIRPGPASSRDRWAFGRRPFRRLVVFRFRETPCLLIRDQIGPRAGWHCHRRESATFALG